MCPTPKVDGYGETGAAESKSMAPAKYVRNSESYFNLSL